MNYNLAMRIIIIIFGIIWGFILYYLLFKKILRKFCFIDTDDCFQLKYRKYGTSAIVKLFNTGAWMWYDGENIFIYENVTGKKCDENYSPVYEYSVTSKKVIGFTCGPTIEQVEKYYDQKGAEEQYLFSRDKIDYSDIDNIIEFLINKDIFTIEN